MEVILKEKRGIVPEKYIRLTDYYLDDVLMRVACSNYKPHSFKIVNNLSQHHKYFKINILGFVLLHGV